MTENSPPIHGPGPASESMHVQLTRMEGVLNLVAERTVHLDVRMEKVEVRASSLEAATQRLDLESEARDKTAVALALALKEAKEVVETTAQAEATKKQSDDREAAAKAALGWSPITKLFAILAAVLIAVNLYQALSATH